MASQVATFNYTRSRRVQKPRGISATEDQAENIDIGIDGDRRHLGAALVFFAPGFFHELGTSFSVTPFASPDAQPIWGERC
jgi:hypothetical protein